ncbi:MAG: molybdopterin biosynthesis protein [Sulfolobales archaeon]|nr:molybdopterin biosynthesis protein [Sulfolobales archaeon]
MFHKLVTLDEALRELWSYLSSRSLDVEEVDIRQALGRVLAEDVVAQSDYPPFDRSEVDGFAVRSSDLEGVEEDSPAKLRVVGSVGVGEVPSYSVEPGTCVEVATGSMLPRGADAVIPVEYARRVGDVVYAYRSIAPGENVAYGGSEIFSGDVVASGGIPLGSADLVVLAAAGVSRVRVYRRIRVGVVSIGDELVKVGDSLKPGAVYDVNSHYLEAALRELGAEAVFYGIVRDREEELQEVLRKAVGECDIVITSGGTSAGVGDVAYRVVEKLSGSGMLFHGLKVRPGKPAFASVVSGRLVIGLPGFPLSAMMVFNILVKPLIAKLLGLRESYIEQLDEAVLGEKVIGYLGIDRLVPVVLRRKLGKLVAYPIGYRSGSVNILQLADGFVRIRAGVPYVDAGAVVTVYRFDNRRSADVLGLGSHDYLLSDVLRVLSRKFVVKYVSAGSLAGLNAVARGVADIAGTHVLDRETGKYNETYIRKLGYGNRVALAVGYLREVGFVVARGNPKNIRDFRDLLRDDVVFVNRSRYSGVRVLVDSFLENLAGELGTSFEELVSKIKGYYTEAKTHNGVALSVLTGRADVGVAVRYVASKYGLGFIPLARERFDIAIGVESLKTPGVESLVNYLRSRDFKELVLKYPGYEVLDNTGEIIFLE